MGNLHYTVKIEAADEGGYIAYVPALPGCHTQGDSLDEILHNTKEAVEAFLISYKNRGKKIPVEKPRRSSSINIQVRPPRVTA